MYALFQSNSFTVWFLKSLRLVLVGLTLIANQAAQAQQGLTVRTETVRGLRTATFATPQGDISITLPDRVKAGATLTGRVYLEPAGTSEAERNRNLAVLHGLVIEVEQPKKNKPLLMAVEDVFSIEGRGTVIASQKSYTWTIGVPQRAESIPSISPLNIILKDNTGSIVGKTPAPEVVWPRLSPADEEVVRLEIAVLRELERPLNPSSQDFQFPRFGQEGRPIQFVGPFDGNGNNTSVIVGQFECPILLEVAEGKTGRLFVQSPEGVVGPADLTLREGDFSTKKKFNSLRISIAATRTNLLRDETSIVTTRVEGFRGLDDEAYPVLFEETNRSPKVIVFQDSPQVISHEITRDQVGEEGVYLRQVTVRGLRAGKFTIDASVFCGCFTCTCDVTMDGKQFKVVEMKEGKFSDLAGNTPFKKDNGEDLGLKDQPGFRIKFKIPSAKVARLGKGDKATVTRTVSLASLPSGPAYIGWRKPKEKDKAERYESSSLVHNLEINCPETKSFTETTAELMFANKGTFDTNNFEIQIDITFSGAECKKTYSFKVTVKDGKATVKDVTK